MKKYKNTLLLNKVMLIFRLLIQLDNDEKLIDLTMINEIIFSIKIIAFL